MKSKLESRIRKCITQCGYDPVCLFNEMGKSYQLDPITERYTLYMNCFTKIGVKNNDTSYVLAGSFCPFIIIENESVPDLFEFEYSLTFPTDQRRGKIYYICSDTKLYEYYE